MWTYKARVERVVDGDTYDCIVDLGFAIYHKIRIRLRAVDTPEVYGPNASPEGKLASEFVKELIEGKNVIITTSKTTATSYGRWEADVYITGGKYIDESLANVIILNNHGVIVEKYL